MTQISTGQIPKYVENQLDPQLSERAIITGIIGERPSQGAKSPVLWNAAYQGLGMDAGFLPFDVSSDGLPSLVDALRQTPAYVGGSVTVPHKSLIMDFLDEVDTKAQEIGAVNTVARAADGRLVGYNTDAQGAIDSLTKAMPWQQQPFLPTLSGLRVLLIGSGGAGRAVAFAVADEIGSSGSLIVANRTADTASELARSVNQAYGNARTVLESEIATILPDVDLVINASLRGQSGLRQLPNGRTICFEPYSSLALADPSGIAADQYGSEQEVQRAWYQASLDNILENQAVSGQAILKANSKTAFFDIIYAPLETTMLSQARLAGHATLNGKGMNLAQAVDGFVNRAMRHFIDQQGWDIDKTYDQVVEAMAQIW